jgi:hypothetical protein
MNIIYNQSTDAANNYVTQTLDNIAMLQQQSNSHCLPTCKISNGMLMAHAGNYGDLHEKFNPNSFLPGKCHL